MPSPTPSPTPSPAFQHVSHGTVKLGLDRSRPHAFRLLPMSNYARASAIPYPPVLAWERPITWGMLGNDTVGNCVIAKTLHQVMSWDAVAHAASPVSFTTEQAIELYSAVTGYNPSNPDSDQGTDPLAMLQYWQTNGVYGHRIAGGVSLDISNLDALKSAIYTFGGVEFDISVPAYVMNVAAGGSWSNTDAGDQTILGGHSILAVGYGSQGFRIVSWGTTYTANFAFWSQFLIGATAAVSADWIKQSGCTPGAGLDLATLLADLQDSAITT